MYCDACWGAVHIGKLSRHAKEPPVQAGAATVEACPVHADRPADQYCVPCKALVCSDCIAAPGTGSHTGHATQPIAAAAPRLRNELVTAQSAFAAAAEYAAASAAVAEAMVGAVAERKAAMITSVEDMRTALHYVVDKHCDQLRAAAEAALDERAAALQAQVREQATLQAGLERFNVVASNLLSDRPVATTLPRLVAGHARAAALYRSFGMPVDRPAPPVATAQYSVKALPQAQALGKALQALGGPPPQLPPGYQPRGGPGAVAEALTAQAQAQAQAGPPPVRAPLAATVTGNTTVQQSLLVEYGMYVP
jgi:hypothetical protein